MPANEDEEVLFPVREIRYGARMAQVVCQNQNGPCPMLAVLNVLLLRGAIVLPGRPAFVSFPFLCNLLSNHMMDTCGSQAGTNRNVEFILGDAIGQLPSFVEGLDVNVRFESITGFEATSALSVFDLLRIRLVHGWVISPEDALFPLIKGKSYNLLVELLCQLSGGSDPASTGAPSPRSTERSQLALAAQQWLDSSAGQITFTGLLQLHEEVQEGELCVLFRNNHFSTLTKHGGELFCLVTDVGLVTEPGVVWEKLGDINGDVLYVGDQFRFVTGRETSPQPVTYVRQDPYSGYPAAGADPVAVVAPERPFANAPQQAWQSPQPPKPAPQAQPAAAARPPAHPSAPPQPLYAPHPARPAKPQAASQNNNKDKGCIIS